MEATGIDRIRLFQGALINAYVSCEADLDANRMFEKLKSNVEPSPRIWKAIISSDLRSGAISRALDRLSEMRRKAIRPDPYTFTDLVQYYVSHRRFDEATKFLIAESSSPHGQPDSLAWIKLIYALGKAQKFEAQLEIVKQVKPILQVRQWNIILEHLGKAYRTAEMLSMFSMMKTVVTPNETTYTTLLTNLNRAKRLDLIEKFVEEAQATVQPDLFLYSAIIKSLGNIGKWKMAEDVYNQMDQHFGPLKAQSHNIAFHALGHEADEGADRMLAVFHNILNSGGDLDEVSWATVLQSLGHCRKISELKEFIQLTEKHNEPNSIIWGAMVQALLKAGLKEEAKEKMEQMNKLGVRKGFLTYRAAEELS
eukprot:TRINITY_DN10803_c0_g1_i1.p2 TRINITY_DN10803_c0_g1~~TRINITY_DN10803_c0_g1_i1.p2  ORF type:complete len:367 (+),score=81.58 TRINITY_DN10803_c0_g1_i1:1600-2700(+)